MVNLHQFHKGGIMIGERIREFRKAQKMSLTELSNKSGVQLATLSRIEHQKMTGTIESHIAIAKALSVDVAQLYKGIAQEKGSPSLPPAEKAGPEVFTHNEKSSYEILTTNIMKKKMMPILLKVEAGGRTSREQNNPGTEKFIFVLEGKLSVHIGKQVFPLSKNNSLYFDAGLEHFFANEGASLAKAICVGTPMAL